MINELAREFMKDYFKCDQGVRCLLGWKWRGKENGGPVGVGYQNAFSGMRSIEDQDFIKFKTIHKFAYIFDDVSNSSDIENWSVHDHIIGVGPIIDIDSIDKIEGKGRLDCLEDNGVVEKWESIRLVLKDELKEWGLWEGARLCFSGNGIYVILADQYGSDKVINQFLVDFIGLCDDVNIMTGTELIDIDNSYPWNKFYKIPFTWHWSWDRLSIPLNKNKTIDRDYLIENSGVNCDVKKVIGDAGW